MKFRLFSVLIAFAILVFDCTPAYSQSWIQKAGLPTAGGQSSVCFTINGKIYAGGGYRNGTSSDFYEYDPATNIWTKKANMPVGIWATGNFVLNGKGYVVCGALPTITNSVYRYDPTTNTWQILNTFPGTSRQSCTGFVINGKAYIVGGYYGLGVCSNELWQYDEANDSWIAKAPIPGAPRNHPTVFVMNNIAYAGLACNGPGTAFYNDMHAYNGITDTWSPIATFIGSARVAAAGYDLNGEGHVLCGLQAGSGYPIDHYSYNPSTNLWKLLCPFNGGTRSHVSGISVNNKAYIGFGVRAGGNYLADMWVESVDSIKASFTNTTCSNVISFTSTSTGVVGVAWNFGDGSTSTVNNPTHTYTSPGTYSVRLIVTGYCRNDTIVKQINTSGGSTIAAFNSIVSSCNSKVSFQNTSIQGTRFSWNFGDGSQVDTTKNPIHTFANAGQYNVQLISYSACDTDTVSQPVNITLLPPSVATFNADTNKCSPAVVLTNSSVNTTDYRWFFSDGDSSILFEPAHSYKDSGAYTITLIASNTCSSDTFTQPVYIPLFDTTVANFTASTLPCDSFATITNLSAHTDSTLWDFGDGSGFINSTNPTHKYTAGGIYTIIQIAYGQCNNDTAIQQITITLWPPASAVFAADTNKCSPSVVLTNSSVNTTDFRWFFGDGDSSILFEPAHSYKDSGAYTISLIASNACSSDTFTQSIYIPLFDTTVANFTASTLPCDSFATITNLSAYTDSTLWDFGDGSGFINSTTPTHKYTAGGIYTIIQIAYGQCNNDTAIQQITITLWPPASAVFAADTNKCSPSVVLTNSSVNTTDFRWFFGDGDSSILFEPAHSYKDSGAYTISLIASNACSSDTFTQSIYIPLFDTTVANFTASTLPCDSFATITNLSAYTDSTLWDFGDGSGFINSTTPTHKYTAGGIYTIIQIAYGQCNNDTATQQITITLWPPASAVFAADTNKCSPSVVLTNSCVNTTDYRWFFGDGDSSILFEPAHSYKDSGAYTISLIASNACSSDTDLLTVYIPYFDTTVADFNAATFPCDPSLSLVNLSQQVVTYSWDFGDGSPLNTLPNPLHNFTSTGLYNITLITYGVCNNDTAVQSVNVLLLPQPQSLFTADTNKCSPSVVISNSSLNASDYKWLFGDGDSSILPQPTHNYQDSGQYTVMLIASNTCGADTLQTTVSIPVFDTTVANFDATSTSCDSMVVINNRSLYADTYFWNFGDGNTSVADPLNSYNYNSSGQYTITLTATGICNSDTTSSQVNVIIAPIPVADFKADTGTCSPTIMLSDSSKNATSFVWNFGDGDTSSSISASHNYSQSGIYTITLVAYNVCYSDTDSVQVRVPEFNLPQAGFSMTNLLCDLSMTTINSSLYADSYLWSFGDTTTSTDYQPSHTYLYQDSFPVMLIASNNCGADTSYGIADKNFALGIANFRTDNDPCFSDVQYTDLSANAFSYYWQLGQDISDSVASPKITYASGGTYDITLTINKGTLCESSITKSVEVGEGQGPIYIPNVFTPNGDNNNDLFEIFGLKDCGPYYLTIFNRWGELVFKSNDRNFKWDGNFLGAMQPAGVFVYVLKVNSKTYKGSLTLIR